MGRCPQAVVGIGVTWQVTVRKAAETDLLEAARWYDMQSKGLGTEFLRAIEGCIAAISRNPRQYPILYRGVRRSLARKFPFGIFYIVAKDTVIILACLHCKRNPAIIRKRS